jgi:integrase
MQQQHRIGDYWLSQRRNSKQWCCTWFDPQTRQTRRASLGTDDFATAWARLAQWVALNGKRDHEDARTALLAEIFVRYQRQHGSKARGAAVQARNLVLLLERLPEGISVSELTLEQQQDVVTRMQADGYSHGTIKRALGAGKAAVNWSWKNGEIDRPVPFLTLAEGDGRERVLKIDELAYLWDREMPPHVRNFIAGMIATAARPEALLQLTKFQCDLNLGVIHLNPHGRVQTKKRRPSIPMANWLRPFIEAAEDHIVSFRGKAVQKINKSFRTVREAAGFGPDVVPYTIRHTIATELMRRGVPELQIAAVLGHVAPIRTTGRYLHANPAHLAAARQALDDIAEDIRKLAKRPMYPVEEGVRWKDEKPLRASRVLVPATPFSKSLISGAGEGIRTLDPNLGKVVLYP